MNFREANGRQPTTENTGLDAGFSNFLFVDQHYGANPVLRRIFSQARKHNFQSVLVEEISEADCSLLALDFGKSPIRCRWNKFPPSRAASNLIE
jgi:hypothetical protein